MSFSSTTKKAVLFIFLIKKAVLRKNRFRKKIGSERKSDISANRVRFLTDIFLDNFENIKMGLNW